MPRKRLLAITYLIVFSFPSLAQSECPLTVGQSIQVSSGEEYIDFFSSIEPRGVFETAAEYEARISEVFEELNTPLVLATDRDEQFLDDTFSVIRYDPDLEQVFYSRFFFDNDFDPAGDILESIGLIQLESRNSYISFNLSGTSSYHFFIFAQPAPYRTDRFDPYFQADTEAEMESSVGLRNRVVPVMTFELPIERARQEFYELYPVIAVHPQPPFLATRQREYFHPYGTADATMLIGEILCGAIINSSGIVLDTVELLPENAR